MKNTYFSKVIRIIAIVIIVIAFLNTTSAKPSLEGYSTKFESITTYMEDSDTLNAENTIYIDRFVPSQREIDLILIGHDFHGILNWDKSESLNNTEGLLSVSLTNRPKDITETEEEYRDRTWKPSDYPFDQYSFSIRFALNTSYSHDFSRFNYKIISRTNIWCIKAGISREYFIENISNGESTHSAFSVVVKIAHPYSWGSGFVNFITVIEIAAGVLILLIPYEKIESNIKWWLGIAIVLLIPGAWLSPEVGIITKMFEIIQVMCLSFILCLVLFSILTIQRIEKIDSYIKKNVKSFVDYLKKEGLMNFDQINKK